MNILLSLVLAAAILAAPSATPTVERPAIRFPSSVAGCAFNATRSVDYHFYDPIFVCPTRTQFAEILKFCAKNRTAEYQDNLFDCEDFAREFHVFASRWALKNFSGCPAGLACGTAVVTIQGDVDGLGYYGPTPVLHAMIVILLADGRLVLVEPRNSKWIFPISAVYEGVIDFHSIEM